MVHTMPYINGCTVLVTSILSIVFGTSSSMIYDCDESFQNDTRPVSGYLSRLYVRSVADCGAVCIAQTGCKSFFYTTSTGLFTENCQLHASLLAPIDLAGLGVETLPTYTYTSYFTVFICPAGDEWVKARFNETYTFHVKVINDITVTRDTAVQKCSDAGGAIPRIVTLDKLNYFRHVIAGCTSINVDGYWVEGEKMSEGDWRTFDNTQLQMSQEDFWYTGRPNDVSGKLCVWISAAKYFLFDDSNCDGALTSKTMCETDTIGV